MTYLQKYVFQWKTKDININIFNMISNKKNLKQWKNIFHVVVNAN